MNKITIPIQIGPGSQPAEIDDAEMNFMQMPSDMTTFHSPVIPEPEETVGLETALGVADDILSALKSCSIGESASVIELDALDEKNTRFIDQLLGEGEVSVQCSGNISALIQESVLAGVWRVQYIDDKQQVIRDTVEVAAIPGLVSEMTFHDAADNIVVDKLEIPQNVYNAAPLLTEISDQLADHPSDEEPYIINLSLLPHTEADIQYLSDSLGVGSIVILSRGYGNCRISSTRTRNVWWVQYFNSQDTLILNTLEISPVPAVACASGEDIEDSTERLDEILSIYR